MPPRALGEAVVERQGHDIEPDIGRALHVVVAAEDVRASAGLADIAGEQQRDAARPHIGGADRVLRLAHAPDQRRRLLRREHLGDALELLAGDAGDALDLLGSPLLDLLAHVVEAVDALRDELLVLPAVLEDVPHHPVEHRDVGPRPQPHIFGRVRSRARHARIDDDDSSPC